METTNLLNTSTLLQGLRLVISGQRLWGPSMWIVGVLDTKDDSRITDVTDENFAATYEGYAGRRPGCAWQS